MLGWRRRTAVEPRQQRLLTAKPIRKVIAIVGLDPAVVTAYALRYSAITRMLLHKVPVRLVALHDTSTPMIERNYSKHIAADGDEHARAALLASTPGIRPAAATTRPADNAHRGVRRPGGADAPSLFRQAPANI